MLPNIPFGPLTLPTGPILAMLAVVVMLDLAGRYGRRLKIHPDDIWNTGLLAIAAGLIVARLWNVFQFWPIYREELLLIFSLRPSGFEFWPGLLAGLIAGYGYLVWRALSPSHVGAALAIGLIGGGVVLELSGHLTGAILGLPTTVPWAVNYFGEQVHPVALYRAVGLIALTLALWLRRDSGSPARTMLLAALGYSLIRLVADGFLAEAQLVGPIRLSQLLALVVALASSWQLAHAASRTSAGTDTNGEAAHQTTPDAPRT